ncbi:DNA utilization protein GntX [Ruegeria denitrificans]|uniref:DNA utilization protein GntX n=1 Tax=Ruegeria denitrificans TaxID=1715692 RepID=A0A0P1IBF1_9RHOB|nr:ComF family protein [Ruegeria denitrificans]CUK03115.1 DNA utilization protein GntX [Ruegeria denitrificans]
MWQRIQTAVELIYPPRCLGCGELTEADFGLCGACWRDTPFIGGVVCESCGVPLPGQADGYRTECDDCMKTPRPWQDGRAALLYDGKARALILALKHGDRPELAKPAARWMEQAGRDLLRDNMLIAPVPLHWSRLLKRRYNQSALLAQHLGRQTGLDVCPDLLVRRVRTPVLDGKTADERADTLSGAIVAHPKRLRQMQGRDVLFVDDVMTSGATLAACARVCVAAGANHIFVLALARVAKDA